MPELPEVEAVCGKLRKDLVGAEIIAGHIVRRRITGSQDPSKAEALVRSRSVAGVTRRGKNILVEISGGLTVRVHLGMTGNLHVIPDYRLRPAALSAWFTLADGRGLLFEDTRGLGSLTVHDEAGLGKKLVGLGMEPLSREFTLEALAQSAAKLRLPAKLFLMDQRRIAGLGNIYAAEALFLARIDPRKPIGSVSRARLEALRAAIVAILREAVRSARRGYSRPGGYQEPENFAPAVYGREGEPCRTCGRKIRRIAQGGRSTYFCPKCQR
jgi:formamidopyrimidine-DNA glycosylase